MSSAPTSERRIDELDGLRGILAWWVVAGHLLRSLGWRFPPSMSPNRAVQAWSVSLEWQFYLLAPLVFLAVRRGHVIVVRSEPLFVHAPHRRPARSRGARARTLTSSG
jgi:peptidoglycan/LPS O-acetylase OafA/YrhL